MESIRALAFGCTFALGKTRQFALTTICEGPRWIAMPPGMACQATQEASSTPTTVRPALWWIVFVGKRLLKHGGWDGESLRTVGAVGCATCCGESGPGACLMQPQRTHKLRNQCTAAGVPSLLRR